MSRESLQWLNTNTLIGRTARGRPDSTPTRGCPVLPSGTHTASSPAAEDRASWRSALPEDVRGRSQQAPQRGEPVPGVCRKRRRLVDHPLDVGGELRLRQLVPRPLNLRVLITWLRLFTSFSTGCHCLAWSRNR